MRRLCLLVMLAACGGGDDDASPDAPAAPDAPIPDAGGPDANPLAPATLAESGLCVDDACREIAADVIAYTPRYELWSDGATKRRWLSLPPGTTIDTSDPDFWQFPEGTKLWKEFSRDGTRVETRLLLKNGPDPDDWYRVAYVWNATQDATTIADPIEGVEDANGTGHDVPARSDCRKCHDRVTGGILGFQAISLDDATRAALNDGGLVSDAVPATLPLPGEAVDQAALGYLHANCGGCHNPTSDVQNQAPLDLRLTIATLATVEGTRAYATGVDVTPTLEFGGATAIFEPGEPTLSAAHLRMTTDNDAQQMPPVGTELVDTAGAAAIEAWIEQLP